MHLTSFKSETYLDQSFQRIFVLLHFTIQRRNAIKMWRILTHFCDISALNSSTSLWPSISSRPHFLSKENNKNWNSSRIFTTKQKIVYVESVVSFEVVFKKKWTLCLVKSFGWVHLWRIFQTFVNDILFMEFAFLFVLYYIFGQVVMINNLKVDSKLGVCHRTYTSHQLHVWDN